MRVQLLSVKNRYVSEPVAGRLAALARVGHARAGLLSARRRYTLFALGVVTHCRRFAALDQCGPRTARDDRGRTRSVVASAASAKHGSISARWCCRSASGESRSRGSPPMSSTARTRPAEAGARAVAPS